MVTDVPVTYLEYVNRDSGVIEEPGHPLDGVPIEDTILIYPKGSGSTVAPFVRGLDLQVRSEDNQSRRLSNIFQQLACWHSVCRGFNRSTLESMMATPLK